MMPTAFDTETELITPGNQSPHLICLTWTDDMGQPQIAHWSYAYEIARELITRATRENPLIGHHTAYDLCVLGNQFPDLMPDIFEAYERDAIADTLMQEKLMDIAIGKDRIHEKGAYSLAGLAQRYLGLTLDKDTWRLRYSELKHVKLPDWSLEAKNYALTDAKVTLDIYEAQHRALNGDTAVLLDAPAQCRADFALKLAANRGMMTDLVAVTRFHRQFQDELLTTKSILVLNGLLKPKGVRDTAKARKRLENIQGLDALRTDTGQIQFTEEACEASGDSVLISYNRYSKLQTLISKDYEILERGTREPIHTQFNVLVNTGRTSSRNPNLQNPRREPGVRECFVPRPGYVFASADYEAAELHTLAQACLYFCGFSTLGEQLNAHIDPHLAFAAQLLYIDYEEAKARKKAGDTKIAETRQMAKAANFGFPGGMGATTFSAYAKGYGFNIDIDGAHILRDRWLDTYPEMRHYFDYIGGQCSETGNMDLLHLVTKRQRGQVHFTAACNSYFQGLAADGAKRALFEVQKHCQIKRDSALFGSHVINFLHDEIMVEVPEVAAHEAAQTLAQVMVAEFNHFVPNVPVSAEAQLMRCWSKNAKPIYGPDGRLVPWETA